MKKLLSLLVVILLSLGAVPAMALDLVPMEFDEVVEIVYFVEESDMVEYPYSLTDMDALKAISDVALEYFGLSIKLETCISTEMATVLNTRLASGTDIPDVMRWSPSIVRVTEMFNQGLLLNLSEYEEYLPNFNAMLEEIPSLRTFLSTSDGNLMALANVVLNPQHITSWMGLRLDWLDALGLDVPQTTEAYREALQAFQDNDMNGNGLPDETLAVRTNGLTSLNIVLSPAFGVKQMAAALDSWYYDDDGQVYATMLTEEARAYVGYLASLYEQGLMWDQSFDDTTEDFNMYKLSESRASMVGAHWDSLLANTELNGYGMRSEFAPIRPLSDGTHASAIRERNYEGGFRMMFSATCEAPERVLAFFDWFYSTEGTQMSYYGEVAPGGNYFVRDVSAYEAVGLTAAPYEMIGTDKYYEELAQEPRLTTKLGANTIFPQGMIAGADAVAGDFYFSYDEEACGRSMDIAYNMNNLEWAVENMYPSIQLATATADQNSVLSDHADMFTYMEEMYIKFIKNVEPMENWDAFVEACENMGMADVLVVQQERYDAYLTAQK